MADPRTYKPPAGSIPAAPGVYRFLDESDRVIYVGKAKSLRSRLASYFQDPGNLLPRTSSMVHAASRVDWVVVGTEREALQLEYQWIKQYAPRFNIRYRDDKSYPFLAVTLGEEFPRVTVLRGNRRKGTRYFGPFAQAWAIRDTVETLLRVFPVRSCAPSVFRDAQRSKRPCLLAHIGRCSAPCVGRVSESEHRLMALQLCDFMAGDSDPVVARVTDAMNSAAQREEFELAARYRDDLGAIDKVLERSVLVLPDRTDADAFSLAGDGLQSYVSVFHIRKGRIAGQRSFAVDRVEEAEDGRVLGTIVVQFYSDANVDVPGLVLLPDVDIDTSELEAALLDVKGAGVETRVPQRGQLREFMETVHANAEEALRQGSLKRATDITARSAALTELQSALSLDIAPYRIECIDISHTGGENVVGSLVVFVDGLPAKNDYRSYIIREQFGPGDPAAIREVVARRFRHQTEKLLDTPDLLIVDGGPLQVAAARAALDELDLPIPVVGLAKRLEEIWLPNAERPLILPRASEALFLLQRVRDESHRTAIGFHRKRRTKAMLTSALDEVPGLGPVRRQALVEHFGSTRAVQQATVDQIAEVTGISLALAQAIKTALDVNVHSLSQAVAEVSSETSGQD